MKQKKKRQKHPGGRPLKLTPEKLVQFKTFIIAGCTIKQACNQIDISDDTWRRFVKNHPSYAVKFSAWKHELEIRAKMNLSIKIMNEKDIDASKYLLNYKLMLKERAAQASLNRARAKQIRVQTKMQEHQLEQVETIADQSSNMMSNLDHDTLVRLSHLADGVDDK